MKKLILLVCGVLIYSIGHAQSPTIVLKNFDKWSIGFNVSATNPNGDATDKKTAFNLLSPQLGYGVTLSKQISHFAGFEFNYSAGKLNTNYSPYTFQSKFKQIDGRFRINFTNGQILADYKKTQIYGFVGVGMINYQTTSFPDSGVVVNSEADWVHVIPFGVGFKKRVGQRSSINFELGYNSVNSDMLDGLKVAGTEKDGYTDVKLGFQYTIGKKKKPLEWDEPLSYFKPLAEHSVDTVVLVKKETIIIGDTSKKQNINTLTIFYDTGDHLINGIYTEDLNQVLNQLKQNKDSWIEILAFCDSTGSEKTNNKLVLQRSRIVTDYFINNDIDKDRIKVYNYGMEFAKDRILSKDRKVIIKYWKSLSDKTNSSWYRK